MFLCGFIVVHCTRYACYVGATNRIGATRHWSYGTILSAMHVARSNCIVILHAFSINRVWLSNIIGKHDLVYKSTFNMWKPFLLKCFRYIYHHANYSLSLIIVMIYSNKKVNKMFKSDDFYTLQSHRSFCIEFNHIFQNLVRIRFIVNISNLTAKYSR